MSPGMKITATTPAGAIAITAVDALSRLPRSDALLSAKRNSNYDLPSPLASESWFRRDSLWDSARPPCVSHSDLRLGIAGAFPRLFASPKRRTSLISLTPLLSLN